MKNIDENYDNSIFTVWNIKNKNLSYINYTFINLNYFKNTFSDQLRYKIKKQTFVSCGFGGVNDGGSSKQNC